MLAPNTILQNRYRVIRQLGQGGMGTVYEALDQRVSAIVALKETIVGENEEARRAFEREAALLANLHHQSLSKVMDYFIEGGGEYLVMEYIPGHDLAELLELRGTPFEVQQVLGWADELLKVLEFLHRRPTPILHRDIKPSNLKLTKQGELFLLDFGLAKGAAGQMPTLLTSRSVRGYTPVYASLEQIYGKGTDTRSDLYSLGATLYHLLTNVPPVDAPTRFDTLEDEEPDPLRPAHDLNPHVHPAISSVIQQAMAVSRKHRHTSATEMRMALRRAEEETQQALEEERHREAEQKRHEQEQRRRTEEEARRRVEEERRRREAEAAARRAEEERREEEERQRREAEETARRVAEEEAARKLAAEKEAARRLEEEQRAWAKEEKARHLAAAAEAERKRAEVERRLDKQARLARAAEEEERRRAAERERERGDETLTAAATQSSPDIAPAIASQAVTAQTQRAQDSSPPDAEGIAPLKGASSSEEVLRNSMSAARAAATVTGGATPANKNRRFLLLAFGVPTVVLLIVAALMLRAGTGGTQLAGGNQASPTRPAETALKPTPPAGMVYVPGGTFIMGRDEKDGGDVYERPAHQATVKPFFIDVYEVTNEEYAKFVRETTHRPPTSWKNGTYSANDARKPVTGVTWNDADDYAKWAGKRLPNEEEWEYAARGADGRLYPWGNDWRAGLANADGASGGLVDVGTYKGASPFGAFDMAGNAWEWTASNMSPYPGGRLPITVSDDLKVIRGGTYLSNREQVKATYRRGWRTSAEDDYSNTGFRCVEDITPR